MLVSGEKSCRRIVYSSLLLTFIITVYLALANYTFFSPTWNFFIPRIAIIILLCVSPFAVFSLVMYVFSGYRAAPKKIELEISDKSIRVAENSVGFESIDHVQFIAYSLGSRRFAMVVVDKLGNVKIRLKGNHIFSVPMKSVLQNLPKEVSCRVQTLGSFLPGGS
jgi:cellulose synthase/poly-beta-1,6-N-acetylglucosamine synthase-like glycosyltransferase